MGKYIVKKRMRINRYYLRHLKLPKGVDADFQNWSKDGKECDAIFKCSDDLFNPLARKSKEFLEEYVITKFGSNIIKDNISLPKKKMDFDNLMMGAPIESPAFKLLPKSRKDAYKEYYDQEISKKEYQLWNYQTRLWDKSLKEDKIQPLKIKPIGYKDNIVVRMGKWF